MILSHVPEAPWSQLSELIATRMGLHFPHERWDDLKRGVARAAQEFGFEDPAACIGWLLSVPPTKAQLQVLANHLAIGETYFFRDRQALEVLVENILPELIRVLRGREQRLRICSAACCSGEAPYLLAILLDIKMPRLMSGIDVLQRLKSDNKTKSIPVVTFTSSAEERDLVGSYQLGVNSYITKPVDGAAFTEVLSQTCTYWTIVNKQPG